MIARYVTPHPTCRRGAVESLVGGGLALSLNGGPALALKGDGTDQMVKIYKPRGPSTNGERVIATDAKDLREFQWEFIDALVQLFRAEHYHVAETGDVEQGLPIQFSDDFHVSLTWVIPHAFALAFKLAGYKAPEVHEQRLLVAGSVFPDDGDAIVKVGVRNETKISSADHFAEFRKNGNSERKGDGTDD